MRTFYVSLAICLGAFCVTLLLLMRVGIVYSTTNSLEYKYFILIHGTKPTANGQYIVFKATGNKEYDIPFIKKVGGMPGDEVICKDRTFSISGVEVGIAKPFRKDGTAVDIGATGVLSENKYFVYGENEDSYDSKYREIGWVDSSDILGVAYPIF